MGDEWQTVTYYTVTYYGPIAAFVAAGDVWPTLPRKTWPPTNNGDIWDG
jgi:hypothetical protein